MRLFELFDTGDGRAVMAVIQGLSNQKQIPSELPFAAFKRYIKGDELGIGTPDALVAFKNKEDPAGDVISDIKDDGKGNVIVVLNTKTKSPDQQTKSPGTGTGPSIDSMASSNTDLTPNI